MLAEGLEAGLSFNKVASTLLKITQVVWKLSVKLSIFRVEGWGGFNILSLHLLALKMPILMT